jgi:hypothetical protein
LSRREWLHEPRLQEAVQFAGYTVPALEMATAIEHGSVSSGDLIALRDEAIERPFSRPLYDLAYEAFQKSGGQLVESQNWDEHSATVLITQRRRWPSRWFGCADWWDAALFYEAEKMPHELGMLLSRIDKVGIQASTVLRATERKAVSQWVAATASQILGMVVSHPNGLPDGVTESLSSNVDSLEDYYANAERRSGRFSYLAGLVQGIVPALVIGVGLGWLITYADVHEVDRSVFVGVFVSGAIGAGVSALTRMGSGKLNPERGATYLYVQLIGLTRPLLGSMFGAILYFALISDLLTLSVSNGKVGFAFYCVLAFFAGFNERWAPDLLGSRLAGAVGAEPSTLADGGGPQMQLDVFKRPRTDQA